MRLYFVVTLRELSANKTLIGDVTSINVSASCAFRPITGLIPCLMCLLCLLETLPFASQSDLSLEHDVITRI